jgi:hypothetical protein
VVSPLWQLPVAGGEPLKIAHDVSWFNFWVIDDVAYYINQNAGKTTLRYLDFAAGRSAIVANDLGAVSAGLTATRDGRTMLFARVDSSTDDLMLVENFR